jgi:hypothetical protein
MFSRNHYNAIAKILSDLYRIRYTDEPYNAGYHEAIEDTVINLADYISPDNPCFDKKKFINDCGIGD